MIYEWREYDVVPGKMPALKSRFENITCKFFEKHGIKIVGYWESEIGGNTSTLYYMIAWRDLAHRQQAWGAFASDPEWLAARAETEKDGPLVQGIRNKILRPTSFSPPLGS